MPVKSLKEKIALVTGAAKRIGREICAALAAEGVNIVIHYRSSGADAEKLSSEIASRGVKTWMVKADFEKGEYDTLISRSLNEAGSLDFLVNNASIFTAQTLSDMDYNSLTKNIQVNAWAPFALSRDFASQAGKGKIINLLDTRIGGYDWAHVPYILSKHLLSVMTRMAAIKFAPNVTVNAVAPGLILPPAGKDEIYLNSLSGAAPLKKHGSPKDVAEAVIYLLKSDFLTGVVINIDGGLHLIQNGGRQDIY